MFNKICFIVVAAFVAAQPCMAVGLKFHHVEKAGDVKNEVVFDGSRNFMGKDVRAYIGQELHLLGTYEGSRKYGYSGFVLDYKNDDFLDKSNVYKCCVSVRNSKYEDMVDSEYTVLDVYPHPKKAKFSVYKDKYYLKLKRKNNGDIVYYEYSSRFKHSFPFLAIKYFEYQRKKLINSEYVIRGRNWISNKKKVLDINTSKPVNFEPRTVWKAKDVVIEDKGYSVSLLLVNNLGESIFLDIDRLKNEYYVISKPVSDGYKEEFGEKEWKRILIGKVAVGMTKKMVEIAWGKPKSINQSISDGSIREQWVYGSRQYLYFRNGIMTSMQVPD